jgi:hypothetical protein
VKFRANPSVRLALTSGHAAIVGPEWRELPAMFHQAALGAGCECDKEQFKAVHAEPQSTPEAAARPTSHDDVYRKALTTMLEREEEGDFNRDGLPNTNVVSKLCGMSARKEDVLRVFRAMQAEAGTE